VKWVDQRQRRNLSLLREIVKEGVNESDLPLQNPLLLVTEPRTCDNILTAVFHLPLIQLEHQIDGCTQQTRENPYLHSHSLQNNIHDATTSNHHSFNI
jgi:hypothetical protein